MGSETLTASQAQPPIAAAVELPAPTAWPIVLALGIALLFTGLVTNDTVSILGAILAVCGSVGWFRDVLPHEKHESIPIVERVTPVVTSRAQVQRVDWATKEPHRARLPLEIYPISAGVKGGLAGSVAMAALAVMYGVISGHGIWYPINLLSVGFFSQRSSMSDLSAFHLDSLIVATILHLLCSVLVGLLYGAMLPMFPRRPILLGGLIAPILWCGVIHSMLEVVDPVLNLRIDWWWFAASQVGFGLVAGIVVSRQERIRTWQFLPFAVRAGIESPGAMDKKNRENERK